MNPYLPDEIEGEEQVHIASRRRKFDVPDEVPALGIALSGGGIRSATFALGVLQGLARAGLLTQFHYLSTVSGGGYVGSFFSSMMHTHLHELFAGREVVSYSQFRVTRDADLWIDEEEVKNLRQALEGELPQRQFGLAVRLEVAARGGGEARLNDVHLQPRELSRDRELLVSRHRAPRRLLAVTQRRVEHPNRILHAQAPPCPGTRSRGSTNGIFRRSSRPTFSMGCCVSFRRNFANSGRPFLFSSIQLFAKLPLRPPFA